MSDSKQLEEKCRQLSNSLAEDMAEEGIKGKTLTLKLKPVTFETFTRSITLPSYVTSYDQICSAALELLAKELPLNIRLMGLRMSNLEGVAGTRPPPDQHTVDDFFTKGVAGGRGAMGEGGEGGSSRETKGGGGRGDAGAVDQRGVGKGLQVMSIAEMLSKQGPSGEEGKVEILEEMGFCGEDAKEALRLAGWSVEGAIDIMERRNACPSHEGGVVQREGHGSREGAMAAMKQEDVGMMLARHTDARGSSKVGRPGDDGASEDEKVLMLMEMGFGDDKAVRCALRDAGGVVQSAVGFLVGAGGSPGKHTAGDGASRRGGTGGGGGRGGKRRRVEEEQNERVGKLTIPGMFSKVPGGQGGR